MPLNAIEAKMEFGIPIFLTQLVEALGQAASPNALRLVGTDDRAKSIDHTAALHGGELLRNGFTIGQVVHGYGDVCQIVTELAAEVNASIATTDFHCFNRCLDDAIAGAVTAFERQREDTLATEGTERRAALAHELRNLLQTATLSFDVMRRGTVGLSGSTGAVHARSLSSLAALVERSLAQVRLEAGLPQLERMYLSDFIEESETVASMHAVGSGHSFRVGPVDSDLAIDVDRQLLASAVSNLLQNAFKFTPAGGNVSMITRSTEHRVFIDICDECGGLGSGDAALLFRPFTQLRADRSGLGLGLSIALTAVHANAGELTVRDIPGTGCVFTVDLPRHAPPATRLFSSEASTAEPVSKTSTSGVQ